MNEAPEPLLFELARPGRRCTRIAGAECAEASAGLPGAELAAQPPPLPEVGELDLVRHYTRLSQRNYGVSTTFYPLGSCTMKYNPVVHEQVATWEGFAGLHPFQEAGEVQGALGILFELQQALAACTGLPAVTLQPAAGAQGELTALLVLQAWLRERGEKQRRIVLIPDSAHGTNPASCTLAGFRALTVRTSERGLLDLKDLEAHLGPELAGLMVTNPNTLGLFEEQIAEVCAAVHAAGGRVYMDGANFNAIVGVARPGDFGVDLLHLNLHKTFSTPHGGGGPGAGPVCATAELEPYLPVPRIVEEEEGYRLDHDRPRAIGRVRAGLGSFLVLLRAYAYLRRLGAEGLRRVAENAVLNANYLRVKVRERWRVPHDRLCMHEFVARPAPELRERGVHTLDVAKRLIELGFHPPTIYFPLVVPEALMIEPTETESRQTLDAFAEALNEVAREALQDPGLLQAAPRNMPVARVDEARAAREPRLCHPCG